MRGSFNAHLAKPSPHDDCACGLRTQRWSPGRPPEPGYDETRTISSSIGPSIARPAEEPLFELAQQLQGFAGYYCENGNLVVGMAGPVKPDQDAVAIEMVSAAGVASGCYNRALPMHVPQIVIARKEHSFLTLRNWRDAIWADFFATDGAIGIGINYSTNRIRLKVEPTKGGQVEALATSLQLPSDAFTIVETERTSPQYACNPGTNGPNLNGNCFRPIPAGVEVTGGGYCTVTAAAERYLPEYGHWQAGVVIAGHCAPPTGALMGRYLYQFDDNEAAQFIGSEYVDPPFWSCGPWGFYRCRYGDSSWVFVGNAAVQQGTIAQTLFPQTGQSGSRYVSATHPRFYVWGKRTALEGMQVEKVGRSTGWTTGTVTDTCSDESTNESFSDGLPHIYICQGLTNLYSQSGDSGSPVFYWWWFNDVDTVELVGLLWGGDGSIEVYTPWTNVESEVGPNLNIRYPSF